ncbi:MAG: MmgE/PrpD family protein [Sphingomonadaceae bacterium]
MSGQIVSLTEGLAARLVRSVAPEARARARAHLLDWLACVAGAAKSDLLSIARRAEPDRLVRAALLGNVLEMDDVDRLGRLHPGPVVWPAALLAARETGADLAALLDAAVRGYEAMIAIGRSLDDHHYARWHPTATAGGFGAAAAAASLLGLDASETVAALGHAGSLAGGLWQVRHEPEALTKSVHVAQAARSGLWFARLAQAGAKGPRFILEGPQGLWAAMAGRADPAALDPAAPGWRITEVSFKPWPACRHAHPGIDAALALPEGALAQGPIRVETYGDALAFCDRPEPRTPGEARFSLQHSIAVVAVRGRPAPIDFEMQAIADPALSAVRARVSVARDPGFDSAYPAHYGARVSAGGASVEVADAWGDPERPLDRAGLEAKARMLLGWGGLAPSEAEAAIAFALDAPLESPVAPLLDRLGHWLA